MARKKKITSLGVLLLMMLLVGVEITSAGSESASDIMSVGETKTYYGYGKAWVITSTSLTSSSARFSINGESTGTLEKRETKVLSDGSVIGIKEILYQSYKPGILFVEFYIIMNEPPPPPPPPPPSFC